MITISHNDQISSIPINSSGGRKEIINDLQQLVATMNNTPTQYIQILGLRQNQNVWPIQLIEATPSTFQEGIYEVVLGDDSGYIDVTRPSTSNATSTPSPSPQFTMPGAKGKSPVIIEYSPEDLDETNLLVTKTGICGLDPHDVYDAILISTDGDGAMTLRQYTNYIQTLLRETSDTVAQSTRLQRIMMKLFYALDNNGTGLASSDDLTSVLVVLCRGTVQHKLRFLFEVFSTPGVDGLTRRQFWRYVRALLTGLVQLSSVGSRLTSSDARRILNAAAIQMSSHVFAELSNANDRVRFEEWEAIFESGARAFEWVAFIDGDAWLTNSETSNSEEYNDNVNNDNENTDNVSTTTSGAAWTSSRTSMRIELPSLEDPSCIEITQGDVALLRLITTDTSLGDTSPDRLHGLLETIRTNAGLVHRADFESCLLHLTLPGRERPNPLVQSTLMQMFDTFDRQDAGVADYDELASGCSLLCTGGKSEKLAMGFEAFDGDEDGSLTRRELWKFLRSFLTAILNFGTKKSTTTDGRVKSESTGSADAAIVEACASIFRDITEASNGAPRSNVTFDEFGAWYNSTGSQTIPWLELLDLKKWPDVTSDADAAKTSSFSEKEEQKYDDGDVQRVADYFEDDEEEDDGEEEDVPPPAPSAPSTSSAMLPPPYSDEEDEAAIAAEEAQEEYEHEESERKRKAFVSHVVPLFATPINTFGDWLEVHDLDVENMRRVVGATKLLSMSPLEMASSIVHSIRTGDNGSRTEDDIWDSPLRDADFLSILEALVPDDELEEDIVPGVTNSSANPSDVRFAEEALAIVFAGLGTIDENERGIESSRCRTAELIAGLTILCTGDKSDKLAVAFDAFDRENQGTLSRYDLIRFLRSFVSVLLSLTEGIRSKEAGSVDDGAHMSSLALSAEVTAVQLSEEIFASLGLDLDSGVVAFDEFAEWYSTEGYDSLQWLELLDRRKWPGQPQFEFALSTMQTEEESGNEETNEDVTPPIVRLRVYTEDVDVLYELLSITGLADITPDQVSDILSTVTNEEGEVTQSDFNRCVRVFVGGPISEKNEVELVSRVLSGCFKSLDRTMTETVPYDELIAGFSLFVDGSKSEKLAVAFQAFDQAGTGRLDRRELWRYLRAFLSSISAMCCNARTPLSLWSIDNACVALTDRIFEDAELNDSQENDESISFEEFADWYTYTGFEYAPWLELLDLKKWFPQPQTDLSDQAEEVDMDDAEEEEEEDMNDSLDATAADDAFGLVGEEEEEDNEEEGGGDPIGDQSLMVVGHAMTIQSQPDDVPAADYYGTDSALEESDDDSPSVLECLVYDLSGTSSGKLSIGPKGCDTLRFFLDLTALNTVHASETRQSMFAACDPTTKCLDINTFCDTMNVLVASARAASGVRSSTVEEISFVDSVATKMYNAFSFDDEMGAMADELACGIAMFSRGSKSEKLAECFDMFDHNGTGDLSERTFTRFLSAILTALSQWTESYWDEGREYPDPTTTKLELSNATETLVQAVFAQSEIGSNGTITFASFADWYTNIGFTLMPWIELIDMKKWPHEAYEEARRALYGYDDQEQEVENEYDYENEDQEEEDALISQEENESSASADETSSDETKEESAVFNVQLNTNGDSLRVHPSNIDELIRLQSATSFSRLTSAEVERVVDAYGTGGAIEPANFVDIVGHFVDDSSDPFDRKFVNSFMERLYENFDREHYDVVDASEIVAALTILTPGSKSDKLASIFHLYDEGHTNVLEKYQLHCFLRCLLVTLSTLADIRIRAESEEDMYAIDDASTAVDMAALEVTNVVFDNVADSEGNVSFDGFADWYTEGGHRIMPWLELLDLDKWLRGRDRMVASDATRRAVARSPAKMAEREQEESNAMPVGVAGRSRKQSWLNEEVAENLNDTEATMPPIFEFTLSETVGSKLSVYPKDVEMIVDTIRLSEMRQRTVEDLAGMFGGTGQSFISLHQFHEALTNMLRTSEETNQVWLEDDEYEFVYAVLVGVFHAMQRDSHSEPNPSVNVDELVGAFAVFVGSGTKSEKLASIFDVFDSDRDGLINREDLWRYIRCVLASLCHLTMVVPGRDLMGFDENATDSSFNRVVQQASLEVIEDIWQYRNILYPENVMDGDDGNISFETFASWYTHGGYEMAAWLELLDHRKWLSSYLSNSNNGEEELEVLDFDEEEEEDTTTSTSPVTQTPATSVTNSTEISIYSPLFEFPIDATHKIVICRHDCQILSYLLWICNLQEVAPIEAVAAMSKTLTETASDGSMDRDSFLRFVAVLCPDARMSKKQTERDFFRVTMSDFFETFDQADIDTVVGEKRLIQARSAMLCSGMLLFCRGSKSEKLAMAFDMFVTPGETDAVDKEMFSLFLLSFMIMISSLTRHGQTVDTGVLHLAARGLARVVYDAVGPTRYVTFQDFADWYTTEGHELVPWLELLDVDKWPQEDVSSIGARRRAPSNVETEQNWDMDDSEDDEEEDDEEDAEDDYKVRSYAQ